MWIFGLWVIPVIGTICGIAYCMLSLCCATTFRSRKQRMSKSNFAPPVSILKPLCGLDPHGYESLRSHCEQDYPEFEIIFGIRNRNDAAIPTVQRLMAEFPEVPMRIVVCDEFLGTNFKVSILLHILPAARHEYLLINDSDISVPADYLRRVMRPLEDGSVGMVTCMYRGIAAPTAGSKLESLGISSDFVPGVLCASRLEGGIHFAMGSTLAFPRRTLEAIGGLKPVADYLADDFQMGYRTSQARLRVELAECIVDHYLPAYSVRGFIQHQLRWARAIRSSRPGGYRGLILTFVIPWSVLALLATGGASWGWVLFASALILRYAVMFTTGLAILHDRQVLRDFWLLPAHDFVALLVWIFSYAGRCVVWRGHKFELVNGRLRPL